jgi:hypothetical protein
MILNSQHIAKNLSSSELWKQRLSLFHHSMAIVGFSLDISALLINSNP